MCVWFAVGKDEGVPDFGAVCQRGGTDNGVGELERFDIDQAVDAVGRARSRVGDCEGRITGVIDRVVGVVAGKHRSVAASPAIDHVIASAACQQVVAAKPAQRVGTAEPIDLASSPVPMSVSCPVVAG